MPAAEQSILLEIPEQPEPKVRPQHGKLKLKYVNRQQSVLAHICIEDLIPADHKARAIWELAGRLDLSRFTEDLCTTIGCAGRPGTDAQLLVSLWVYAYSEGISGGRTIHKVMQWEPGMMWLSGLEKVNYHTLTDFRVDHKDALDELFAQLLAQLDTVGLVSLEQVAHDGTKIRAQAGVDSFRREKSMRERLAEAREVMKQMEDPRVEGPAQNRRKQAAQERAARERLERLEAAAKEMEALQAEEKEQAEKDKVRVSLTEPEARKMKHGDNAIAPSYNAQLTTETGHKIIVGAHATQCSSDANSLLPALEEVAGNLAARPQQVIVDGGFTNRENILECARQGIDLIGSLTDPRRKSEAAMKANGIDPNFAPHCFRILENGQLECPAGCSLPQLSKSVKHGNPYQQYRARGEDCLSCRYQAQCCPRKPERGRMVSIRLEEHPEMTAFRQKMESEERKASYRKRGPVAEFPNAWIKEKLGLRKFRVRGLVKAETELMWACLTYNIMQWVRLVWRQPATA